jgi:hypothetical protein
LVSAGWGRRNHSHANPATNYVANGFEPGKPDTQSQATARADRVVFHLILERITGRKTDMVVGEGIAKRDRPLLADRMIARCDQDEPVFGKRKGLQFFGGVDLVTDDTDLGEVSGDSAHDVAAGMLLELDIDQGMLRQESG